MCIYNQCYSLHSQTKHFWERGRHGARLEAVLESLGDLEAVMISVSCWSHVCLKPCVTFHFPGHARGPRGRLREPPWSSHGAAGTEGSLMVVLSSGCRSELENSFSSLSEKQREGRARASTPPHPPPLFSLPLRPPRNTGATQGGRKGRIKAHEERQSADTHSWKP